MSEEKEMVNHPSHYNQGGIECIDAMIAAYGNPMVRTFCELNAFKYIFRSRHKGNRFEDIKKAEWYLNKAIELYEEDNERIHKEMDAALNNPRVNEIVKKIESLEKYED